jgi:hypothetical protein
MSRPPKYATAMEAAHNNLYSKMGGLNTGLPLEQFIHIATGKCEICGQRPQEALIVNRKDGGCTLLWHYVMTTETKHIALCKMCRMLASQYDMKELISHCARIMARRMWHVHTKWLNAFFQGQDKLLDDDVIIKPCTGVAKKDRPLNGT